jgi:hypothetical protein
LVPALLALALKRGSPGGLKIDALKLSHHGGRANVTTEMLKAVHADHDGRCSHGRPAGFPAPKQRPPLS